MTPHLLGAYWSVLLRHSSPDPELHEPGDRDQGGLYLLKDTLFSASASLLIQDRQPNQPDIYGDVSAAVAGSEIATELQVLSSRDLSLSEPLAGVGSTVQSASTRVVANRPEIVASR